MIETAVSVDATYLKGLVPTKQGFGFTRWQDQLYWGGSAWPKFPGIFRATHVSLLREL